MFSLRNISEAYYRKTERSGTVIRHYSVIIDNRFRYTPENMDDTIAIAQSLTPP